MIACDAAHAERSRSSGPQDNELSNSATFDLETSQYNNHDNTRTNHSEPAIMVNFILTDPHPVQ